MGDHNEHQHLGGTGVSAGIDLTVFRRSDMLAMGIDPALARTYIRQGLWARLHYGVYTASSTLEEASRDPVKLHVLLARVAIKALPDRAYAFGRTAAVIHGLPTDGGPPTEITLIRPRGTDQRALQRRITGPTAIHDVKVRSHLLRDGDLTVISGVPCVTKTVAAVSAAATQSLPWAVAALDAACWQSPQALEDLVRVTEEWPRLLGIGTVRKALELARTGAQSPFESLSRVRLIELGLPEPELQRAFYDSDGLIGYADMSWDDGTVVGECDGLAKYGERQDLIREKLREDRLRDLGVIVVRWTWHELMTNPGRVAARIQRAREAAARRRLRAG